MSSLPQASEGALDSIAAAAPRRLGVFGGAFDPPHNAHLALVKTALDELQLDELHVLPTGHAWHKTRALTPAAHRLAMAQLAFGSIPGVVVDERELQRPGPSFTVDTVRALQLEHPDAQLYLIIGGDQFALFRQWHEWEALVQIAIICIAARATSTLASGQFDAYVGLESRFLTLHLPLMAVSATQVRQLLAANAGDSCAIDHLVPAAVARYISSNRLYTTA